MVCQADKARDFTVDLIIMVALGKAHSITGVQRQQKQIKVGGAAK